MIKAPKDVAKINLKGQFYKAKKSNYLYYNFLFEVRTNNRQFF